MALPTALPLGPKFGSRCHVPPGPSRSPPGLAGLQQLRRQRPCPARPRISPRQWQTATVTSGRPLRHRRAGSGTGGPPTAAWGRSTSGSTRGSTRMRREVQMWNGCLQSRKTATLSTSCASRPRTLSVSSTWSAPRPPRVSLCTCCKGSSKPVSKGG